MEFKKIYIEVTNNCNLNCDFCIGNKRYKKFMTMEEFKIILNKLQGFTKYLYLHVMGEPLLHPQVNELINEAALSYFVNITTNGYLIDKIKDNKNIRQVNISLHSFDKRNGKSLDEYLDNIFNACDELVKAGTFISYRMWIRNKYLDEIVKKLNDHYKTRIDGELSTKLADKVFYKVEREFIWPSLDNDYYREDGTCYGTRHHIGILVDGTVIPCCLDSGGLIDLGNIYKRELSDIIGSDKFTKMQEGFLNNKRVEELCKHCNFCDMRKEV